MALLQQRVKNAVEHIKQQNMLDKVLEFFITAYCKETSLRDFKYMNMDEKNKVLEAGLGVLKLEHFKKKEYA
jgi:hypothetical protein